MLGFKFYVKLLIVFPFGLLFLTFPYLLMKVFSKDKAMHFALKNDWLDKWLFR